jgi:hypothetical protein
VLFAVGLIGLFAAREQRDCNCDTLGFPWSPRPAGPDKGCMTPARDERQARRTQGITTLLNRRVLVRLDHVARCIVNPNHSIISYGRGAGEGRGRAVGVDLGVGVGVGVKVAVGVGVNVAVAVAVAVAVGVGVGVGVPPLWISKEPLSIRPFTILE